jgi:hypothetical protein
LVAFRCRRAHQSAASGAELRTHLLRVGPEHPRELASPAVKFVAPSNGKRQVVSLLENFRLPIIAGIRRGREIRIGQMCGEDSTWSRSKDL